MYNQANDDANEEREKMSHFIGMVLISFFGVVFIK
jgi:hypothetical protein